MLQTIKRLGLQATVIFVVLLATSCKKDDVTPSLTQEQTWSQQIYNEMKDIYLWDDALPKSFDPSKYATADDALSYLISLKINPETNKPIDRYSFLDPIGNLSGEITGGTSSGDYGFMLIPVRNNQKTVTFFVNYVYKNSPAGRAGIQRGFYLTKVNGSSDVNPPTIDSTTIDVTSSAYKQVVNAFYNSTSATFTFVNDKQTSQDFALNTASYSINAVLKDSVYTTSSGKKVGYIVFNQFLGSTAVTEFTNSLDKIAGQSADYLIVDLRYNTGGSVATCEALTNMIVPASANGSVMYSYVLNSTQTSMYTPSALITKINKTNSYSPKEVYFIVSGNTASASELLINNLLPYFPGKIFLIGYPTYGKPVGFWATPIGYTENQTTTKTGYDLYAVSFKTINANGNGGYFRGMIPGTTSYPGINEITDGFRLPWGNTNDPRLAQALYHIENGSFSSTIKSAKMELNSNFDNRFKGMVDYEGIARIKQRSK